MLYMVHISNKKDSLDKNFILEIFADNYQHLMEKVNSLIPDTYQVEEVEETLLFV